MSWRTVVISNTAKLDYQMGFLVVRGTELTRVHLSEIGVLIIETTSVSLTAALLSELTKKKIKVIFCDEKRNPFSELMPYYGSHDTSSKIRMQIKWDGEIKKEIWVEIVSDKIRKQAHHLGIRGIPDAEVLFEYSKQVTLGDETNREGHAAKVYFNALFGKGFTRSEENSVNAALNYGYSLLLSSFTREIVANGYLTQLGLFHDNMFNPFNLASDLMEPFRPIVDYHVVELMPDKFDVDEKRYMLLLLQDEVTIAGRNEILPNAIKIYCRSVFDALCDRDVSMIHLYDGFFEEKGKG